jgi:hypothetical protein
LVSNIDGSIVVLFFTANEENKTKITALMNVVVFMFFVLNMYQMQAETILHKTSGREMIKYC